MFLSCLVFASWVGTNTTPSNVIKCNKLIVKTRWKVINRSSAGVHWSIARHIQSQQQHAVRWDEINQNLIEWMLSPTCRQTNIKCWEYFVVCNSPLIVHQGNKKWSISICMLVRFWQSHPIMVRKGLGMRLITMGGEVFSIHLLHFLTDAVIHSVRGRLVRVKYRA